MQKKPADIIADNRVIGPAAMFLVDGNNNLSNGGGTQYTDGASAPAHPIGNEIVFNNAGTMTAVSNSNPLPTSATVTPAANQRVNAQANDFLTGSIVDLVTLLARLTDTYGTNTAISAGTTFGSIPLVSALAANSYATLTNASYQDTFLVQINVASAFVGTISFYGLEPDGSTLQLINAHQRNSSTNGNSTAINTGSALNQVWEGSIAGFKAVYVVCTAFTSGAASVQLGLTAANYAHAIVNTVAQNLTQVNGSSISLGRTTKSASLPVTMASDQDNINVAVNAALPAGSAVIGSTTIQATSGTALVADQSNTELRVSNYVKTTTAGDTALTLAQATMANSLPVTMASDQTPKTASTATKTSVAAAASDTAILSSNSSRKGAKFYNDSTAICYLSEGSGAASTSSYTVQIPANGFYEQPPEPVYTGAYRAIWSAANGNLRITENT